MQRSHYEFGVDDYRKFNVKAEGTKLDWVVCSCGTRVRTYRNAAKNNSWDNEEVEVTRCFDELFTDYGIDKMGDVKTQLLQHTTNDKKLYEQFMYALKLTLQMRNSITGDDSVDYILSPVANAEGQFYDSREGVKSLPIDADANGAYNIARKGLWVIEKIEGSSEGDKLNLNISNKEWLQFVQH